MIDLKEINLAWFIGYAHLYFEEFIIEKIVRIDLIIVEEIECFSVGG